MLGELRLQRFLVDGGLELNLGNNVRKIGRNLHYRTTSSPDGASPG